MTEDQLIRLMAQEWPEIAEGLKPNHCIIAARVAVEVGRYFGIPIEARAVDAIAYNKSGGEMMTRGVPLDEWPEEAWSVGIVKGIPGPGYDGHVIAESPRFILDLAAGQFNRPWRALDCPGPIVIEKPEEYDPAVVKATRGDTTIVYRSEVGGRRFMGAPDWRNELNFGVEAAALIRVLRSHSDRTVNYPVGSEVDR